MRPDYRNIFQIAAEFTVAVVFLFVLATVLGLILR